MTTELETKEVTLDSLIGYAFCKECNCYVLTIKVHGLPREEDANKLGHFLHASLYTWLQAQGEMVSSTSRLVAPNKDLN